ncbi:MAG: nicotinate phosphoribosyltransferase [Chromatiales bacterium]|nr:nicotinate phosphoribosyltransferase [Chromatiales bacterium]
MAYGYWKAGIADREACFSLSFRRHPYDGGYSIACGFGTLAEYIDRFRFDASDLDYLSGLKGHDSEALFEEGFLRFLEQSRICCNIDAVLEGSVVFPHEPLLRVRGPIWQAQILETPILNIINFQTLIATKAARVCEAADGDPVLEFGLRRAHGVDGALAASRAAYIGGCSGTSNVLAGKLFNVPVRGTHAHSWVMSFDTELEAFKTYAAAMPNNCVFLVDTYDSIQGVRNAIEVGNWLKSVGHQMLGIRLDSGDLAYISIEARKLLDDAGFADCVIFASNDLDERLIESLKKQGATIAAWGVGTKLVTGSEDGALGGVYKITAIRDEHGQWQDRIKLSEQAAKVSTPGILQVRRFSDESGLVADAVYNEAAPPSGDFDIVDPIDHTRRRRLGHGLKQVDLLTPFLTDGALSPGRVNDVEAARAHVKSELGSLHATLKRLTYPHTYPVGLERGLHDLRTRLVLDARSGSN